VLALSECFDNEGEGEKKLRKPREEDIELFEAGEDAAVAFYGHNILD
jgi:hypothetical protein